MKTKFDEVSVESLLAGLKNRPDIKAPEDFAASVMSRIRQDADKSVRSFDGLFLRFSIGASVVAAASLLLAINLFTSYTPGAAEYAAVDYFNMSIF